MSKLDELIAELCPDGVEYVKLGDLCEITSAGVDKKIVANEQPVKLLNYMDVYKNRYITADILSMEVTASTTKVLQCNIEEGDIFITPSSETIDDIGHSAVAVEAIEGAVYSYHVMRLRLRKPNMITSFYISYAFSSYLIQKQIIRLATGLTRYGLTKSNWEKIRIPLPPLQVQREIVRILDNFTELTAELTARRKQYEYYRKILIKNSNNIRQYSLGELATLKTGSKPKDVFEFPHKYEYINAGTTNSGYTDKANCDGDTVTTPSRGQGGIGFVGYQYDPFWLGPLCYRIKSRNDKIVTNRYLFYYLSCFNEKILAYKKEGGTPSVNASDLVNIIVDVPPLTEQKRIVAILDRFDALCNDLTSGIPAEIEARQKQYEYYRDKLLSFKGLGV